jgi:tetratricopeptide (TPR) repeat protein
MNQESPDSVAAQTPEEQALGQFWKSWVAEAPAELQQALRHAALPHHFDLALLAALWSDAPDPASVVEQLQGAGFVTPEGGGQYSVEPSFRRLSLARWQVDDLASYRAASARAAAFFADRLDDERNQLAYVYHMLGADDERGISALAGVFEQAVSRGRLGHAEQLLLYAQQQERVLDRVARAWVRYYRAHLDLLYGQTAPGEESLRALIDSALPPDLQAQAALLLGDLLANTQRLGEAEQPYDTALQSFLSLHDPVNAARVLTASGNARIRLAGALGGLSPERREHAPTRATRLLWNVRDAPFLLYRWCSRRVIWLPNLYFSSSYQDWIILRILGEAERQYRRAVVLLANAPPTMTDAAEALRVDLRIRLADLLHRTGRWARGERELAAVAGSPILGEADYRRAVLRLAEGRAALAHGRPALARNHLAETQRTFNEYADYPALVDANRLLGDACLAGNLPDAAVASYAEAYAAAVTAGDLPEATAILAGLTSLNDHPGLSTEARTTVAQVAAGATRRAYIARFPGPLMQQLRGLTTYLIVPVTYLLLAYIVSTQVTQVFFTLEGLSLRMMAGLASPQEWLEYVSFALLTLAIPVLMLWVYQLMYLIVGGLFLRTRPARSLADLQPAYFVTVPEGLLVRHPDGQQNEIRWDAVERYVTLDRYLWHQPFALFSRVALAAGKVVIRIDGIVGQYQQLQQDIMDRLSRAGRTTAHASLDVSVAGGRSALAAVLLAIALTIYSLTGPLKQLTVTSYASSGPSMSLNYSVILLLFDVWLLLLLPFTGLLHLLLTRITARWWLGLDIVPGSDIPLWFAAALLLGIMALAVWAMWHF